MSRTEDFNKNKVLDAAINTFWKKGYHGTSLQDLVDATELNRSSIYNSFDSKLGLYKLAIRKFQKDRNGKLNAILIKSGNPREALQMIFADASSKVSKNKEVTTSFEVGCKIEMANQDKEIFELLKSTQDLLLEFFESIIKDGQKRGLINERQSANDYAYFILNSYEGLHVTGLFMDNKNSLQTISQNTLRMLM